MQIAHIQGEAHRENALTLTPRAPWTWLPAASWPAPRLALPKQQREQLTAPWPTVWIGAGRRTAPYSAWIREASEGRTLVVHILDPQMEPDRFDLLITPQHDELSAPNVISTVGSPSYFSPDDQEQAGLEFAHLADERAKSALVVLGGNSRTHTFTMGAAETLAQQLKQLAGKGWRLRMTASRRTPPEIIARMRALAEQVGAQFWAGSSDGPNPYLAWLSFSDVAIVTEDSSNMLSDAAYHGLPIHMVRLSGRAAKFDRLHEAFIARSAARWFDGELETWSYEPLREADRVADAIVAKLLERHPQPRMGTGPVIMPDWM